MITIYQINGMIVATLSHDQMIDILRKPGSVSAVIVPPFQSGKPRKWVLFVCHPCCNLLMSFCVPPGLSFPCYVFFPRGISNSVPCIHSLNLFPPTLLVSISLVVPPPQVMPTPLPVSFHTPLTHLIPQHFLSQGYPAPQVFLPPYVSHSKHRLRI